MTVQQNQESLSMVERVARAISRSQVETERMWQSFLPEARAAIEAMRDPTEEMRMATGDGPNTSTRVYQAMIDAAREVAE